MIAKMEVITKNRGGGGGGGGEAPPAPSPKSASVSSVSNITTSFAFFNAAKTPDKIQGSGPDWYEIAPLNKNSDSALS